MTLSSQYHHGYTIVFHAFMTRFLTNLNVMQQLHFQSLGHFFKLVKGSFCLFLSVNIVQISLLANETYDK